MTRRILSFALVAVLAGAAGAALAARSLTLTAPTAYNGRGGWRVCVEPDTTETANATRLVATTFACGWDAAAQTRGDCRAHDQSVSIGSVPVAISGFIDNRIAAWTAAGGY